MEAPDQTIGLTSDVGASRARAAICDVVGNILAGAEAPIDVAEGPVPSTR
jgi:ribulose kinase